MPRKPSALTGTAEPDTMIDEHVASDILELLADERPRTEADLVRELVDYHHEDDVALTLAQLVDTEQVEMEGGRYTLAGGGV